MVGIGKVTLLKKTLARLHKYFTSFFQYSDPGFAKSRKDSKKLLVGTFGGIIWKRGIFFEGRLLNASLGQKRGWILKEVREPYGKLLRRIGK